MRILLLGKNGQLGWELRRSLVSLGTVSALDAPEIDVCDTDAIRNAIREFKPALVINATAYTAVDRAETEAETAMAVNGQAPGTMAEMAAAARAAFIHYSTDYVFDGATRRPYSEDDRPNPLGVYAASKLAGEQSVEQAGGAYLVLRTSWLYSLRRDSFVTKVLGWARHQTRLRVVSDQVSNPTWARAMAEATAHLAAMSRGDPFPWMYERRGLYHLAGDGYASRLEWAQAILEYDPHPEEQRQLQVEPALTSDFPTPAQRPLFSALDCTRIAETFGMRLPPWKETLQLALQP